MNSISFILQNHNIFNYLRAICVFSYGITTSIINIPGGWDGF